MSSMEEESQPACFEFETDQLALRENADYSAVLATLGRLESLRVQSLANLDRLYEIKKKALENPIEFVEKLQSGGGEELDIPSRPAIPSVPKIDWSKYSYTTSDVGLAAADVANLPGLHDTRRRKVQVPDSLLKSKGKTDEDVPEVSGNTDVTIVRGRVKTESQPATYNQLWTSEEQRRLEELLIEFPPERVEARRFRKIADQLGTKTLKQVCSRIQKYFITLARARLPVPGRVPNLSAHRRKLSRKRNMNNKMLNQSSTMLQSFVPPVFMTEDNDGDGALGYDTMSTMTGDSMDSDELDGSDDDEFLENLPDELKNSDDWRELMELRALRQAQLDTKAKLDTSSYDHDGYKCDGCGQEPIHGTRYSCTQCATLENSIDFCQSCNNRSITLATHKPSHNMRAYHVPTTVPDQKPDPHSGASNSQLNDKDYLPSKFNIPGHYNYLDPNYMPSDTDG